MKMTRFLIRPSVRALFVLLFTLDNVDGVSRAKLRMPLQKHSWFHLVQLCCRAPVVICSDALVMNSIYQPAPSNLHLVQRIIKDQMGKSDGMGRCSAGM